MKKNNTDKSDLEYLADLGFEQVPVNPSDLDELKSKFSSPVRSSGTKFYVSLLSLFAGIGIGLALFYILSDKSPAPVSENKRGEKNDSSAVSPLSKTGVISLDTVVVDKENYIKPGVVLKNEVSKEVGPSNGVVDSADIIISKPIDLSLLQKNSVEEEKLKFIINAPVFYLHDLKVTNYSTLYFKKNRFVRFSGLSAAYSNTTDAGAESGFKETPEVYLHEEIANALLYFKTRQYDQAINSLKLVATFNNNDLNCSFYLALCYYNKKNYSRAIALFDECIGSSNNTFLQEAMFYKALSLYEDNRREEAKVLFKVIAGENEFYAEKAKIYLRD